MPVLERCGQRRRAVIFPTTPPTPGNPRLPRACLLKATTGRCRQSEGTRCPGNGFSASLFISLHKWIHLNNPQDASGGDSKARKPNGGFAHAGVDSVEERILTRCSALHFLFLPRILANNHRCGHVLDAQGELDVMVSSLASRSHRRRTCRGAASNPSHLPSLPADQEASGRGSCRCR